MEGYIQMRAYLEYVRLGDKPPIENTKYQIITGFAFKIRPKPENTQNLDLQFFWRAIT